MGASRDFRFRDEGNVNLLLFSNPFGHDGSSNLPNAPISLKLDSVKP
jgi:hypothetical protein